jgi:hypothetical protein
MGLTHARKAIYHLAIHWAPFISNFLPLFFMLMSSTFLNVYNTFAVAILEHLPLHYSAPQILATMAFLLFCTSLEPWEGRQMLLLTHFSQPPLSHTTRSLCFLHFIQFSVSLIPAFSVLLHFSLLCPIISAALSNRRETHSVCDSLVCLSMR